MFIKLKSNRRALSIFDDIIFNKLIFIKLSLNSTSKLNFL